MSRPTSEDIAQEWYEAELAEQEDEEYFRNLFGDEVTANELNAYAEWLAPGLQAAEALNKSSSRAVICVALAGMPNFMIDSERDAHLERPGPDMLEAIVPPSGNPMWAPYGRPTSLFHQLHRMEGNDKKGKPVGLIEIDYYPRAPNAPGQVLKSYKLTRTGICYAHIHGRDNVTKDDLVKYWRHATQGVEVAATNYRYLALAGQKPPPDDSIYQYETGSWPWGVLDSLAAGNVPVPESYRDHSGIKLSKALGHVYADEAAEAMKCLNKEDQRALCHDVLLHSNVDNKSVRDDIIDGLYGDKVTYSDRVQKLVRFYSDAHPDADADRIITELICRATWVVIRRVMNHRMADGSESDEWQPSGHQLGRWSSVQALDAIKKLDVLLGKFAEATGAQQSGYEGEWVTTTAIRPVDDEEPF